MTKENSDLQPPNPYTKETVQAKFESLFASSDFHGLSVLAHKCVCEKEYEGLQFLLAKFEHAKASLENTSSSFSLNAPVKYAGSCEPLLHRAIRLRDVNSCQLLLAAGIHPLLCAQRCCKQSSGNADDTCEDSLQLAYRLFAESDRGIADVACLLVAAWSKTLQRMIIACQNGDSSDIEALLQEFKQATCTHSHYTQTTGRPASPQSRSSANTGLNDVVSEPANSSGRGLFQALAEGAGRAISGLWAAGEQLLDDSFERLGDGRDCLMKQTYSSVVQLTQEYFNAMLITAIERQNSPIINMLLDFGLNFRSVCRPSAALGPAVGIWCPEIDESLCSSHQTNPVTLFVDSRHRSWLTLALEPRTDTALLAAARSLGAEEAFCKIFSKSPELSNIPGTDGILPIHLVSALGKVDLLRHMLSFTTADESPLACQLRSCQVNDMPALYASPFCVDMIDDNGMSAFLLACFYGHLECLRLLLDLRVAAEPILPSIPSNVQTPDSPLIPVDRNEEGTDDGDDDDAGDGEDLDPSLLEPQPQFVCPVDFFRTIAVQWQFIADSRLSNVVLLNPEMHSQGRHICGQFGALHLAVMTGNLELTAFLLPYLAEDINKPGLPCGHAPSTSALPPTSPDSSTPLCFVNKATPELSTALKTPLGLACCLSDVKMHSGDTAFPLVRLLVAFGAHDTKNALLHLLLQRGRFELAGLILSAAVNTLRPPTKCVASPFSLDWSDMRLCAHLKHELQEPTADILGTLLLDWFAEAHWQAQLRATAFLKEDTVCSLEAFSATPSILSLENLTKLSLANNDLEYIPMCLFTQLPNIQLDLSRNHIKSLPDLWRTLTDNSSSPRLFCEHLRHLELSRNNLTSLPPWLFGAPITPSPSAGQSDQGPLVFGNFAPRLGVLRLGRNRIRTVPRHMWLAPCLFHLDLSENQIEHLPTLSNDEVVLATRNRALGRTSVYSFPGRQSTASSGGRPESISSSSAVSLPVNPADCLASLPRLPNALKLVSSLESAKEDCDHQASSGPDMAQTSTSTTHRWTGGLVHLWLQHNRLRELPMGSDAGLGRQPQHKRSDPSLIGVTSFSESPPSATSMTTFMFDARLSHLAPNLVSLDASFNQLVDFGVPADYPSGLVVLDLGNNCITSVGLLHSEEFSTSTSFGPFTKQLSTQSKAGSEEKLQSRFATNGCLRNLLHLNLRFNQLRNFNPVDPPPNVCQQGEKARLWFPQLTSLDLSGNAELVKLGSSVCRMKKISVLELDSCSRLQELPPDLWRLDKLKSLTFFETPAYAQLSKVLVGGPSSPRPPTQQKDAEPGDRILNTATVLAYLRALPRCSKPYTKIRLMVLGPPGVGKTAFVRSFCRAEQANAKHRNPRGSPISYAVSESGSTSDQSNGQAGVRLSSLRITRKRPDTLPASASADWCEDVTFSIWDFDGALHQTPRAGQRGKRRMRLRTGRSAVAGDAPESTGEVSEEMTEDSKCVDEEEDEADAHAAALSAVQQFCLSRSAVYVVVWRATDGPRGLEGIAKFLVDIQCRAPLAPVFIIGTHRDLCPETPSTVEEVDKFWSLTELNEIVYRRYFRYTDPAAMGLPSCLQGHVILDCKSNASSAQSALSHLATLIHRSANQMRLSSRTTSVFLPHVKAATTAGTASSPRFLGLLIPSFYHDLEEACHLLAADLRAAKIPPIISLEDFIAQTKSRLQACHQKVVSGEAAAVTDDTSDDATSSEDSDFNSPAIVRGAVAFLNEVGVVLHLTGATLGRAVVVDPPWLCGLLFRVLALGAEDAMNSAAQTSNHSPSRRRQPRQSQPTVPPYFSVWRRLAPLSGHKVASLNKIAPAIEGPASIVGVRSPNLSIRAGVLKLSALGELLAAETSCDGDLANSQFEHLDRTLALTYLVGLLIKFELAVPLDAHHLLMPTLLPTKSPRTSGDAEAIPRQVYLTPHPPSPETLTNAVLTSSTDGGNQAALRPVHGLDFVNLADSDPLNCAVFTLRRRGKSRSNPRSDLTDQCSSLPLVPTRRPGLGHQILAKLANWQSSLAHVPLRAPVTEKETAGLQEEEEEDVRPWIFTVDDDSASLTSSQRSNSARRASRSLTTPLPQWELRGSAGREIFRLYVMAYIPAGFWTRLITRLLTDSSLNAVVARRLYNLADLPPALVASLLSLEPAAASRQEGGSDRIEEGGDDGSQAPPSPAQLFTGWSVWRSGLRLALVGGYVPVLTLEQVGGSVSSLAPTADGDGSAGQGNESVVSEVGDEASELNVNVEEPTPLTENDFKSWHLRLLRFSHQRGENDSTDRPSSAPPEAIDEPFADFSAYCLVQLHLPVLSIVWPDPAGDQKKFVLDPDPKIVAQMLTKVTYHIDCLLEDWYPDLGTRFHQSTSGTLLIHRVVPCTACVRHISPCSQEAATETRHTVSDSRPSTLQEKLHLFVPKLPALSAAGDGALVSPTDSSCGTANLVYGILVEEFVHWFLSACGEPPPNSRLRLACLLHPTFTFPAHDLVFDDIGDDFLLPTSKVFLDRFLGRGTFGSVFGGSLCFNAPAGPSSVDPDKIAVAVKVCSPIDPLKLRIRLDQWRFELQSTPRTSHVEDVDGTLCAHNNPNAGGQDKEAADCPRRSSEAPKGVSDVGVAEALYRQEQRRWKFQPVESCFTAYQELRSELSVLLRINPESHVRDLLRQSSPRLLSGQSVRVKRGESRRLTRPVTATLPRRRPLLEVLGSGQSANELRQLNPHSSHLLTCLGIVSPRPLGLILPLAPKGSLSDWMSSMRAIYDERSALAQSAGDRSQLFPIHPLTLTCLIHQVALALSHLHSMRIVYRDLKPDNLLVWRMPEPVGTENTVSAQTLRRFSTLTRTTGSTVLAGLSAASTPASNPCSVTVVLGDYGVSRTRANLDGCRGYVGTPGYMAPEILEYFGEETYTAKVDIYSFGILMASIINMQAPFHGFTNLRFQLTQHILSGGRPVIPVEIQRQCPLAYLDLMTLCWSSDPSQRPSADEIVALTSLPDHVSRPSALRRTASGRATEPAPTQPSPSFWNYRAFVSSSATTALSPVSEAVVDHGFARLRSATRVDCLKTITCATIDGLGRLWLGGQCSPSSPSADPNKNSSQAGLPGLISTGSDCSPSGLCSAYDSTCLGRLVLVASPVCLGGGTSTQGRLTTPTGRITAATASATGTSPSDAMADSTARLACVWSVFTSVGGSFSAASNSLPPAGEPLPLSLTGPSAFPTALCHSSDFTAPDGAGILWCADSCGRLFAICCSTLTLLAAVTFFEERLRTLQPPRETAATCSADDCIVLFPMHQPPRPVPRTAGDRPRPVASVILGLATGWLGAACLSRSAHENPSVLPAHSLRIDWTDNLLRRQCRLYLCGAEVGRGLCWLAGTGSSIAAYTTSFAPGNDAEITTDLPPVLRLKLDASWHARKPSSSSSRSEAEHTKCGRLCSSQSLAVTSIAVDTTDYGSNPEGLQASEAFVYQRVWTYTYPAHEVTCWSVDSRSPLRSISLFGLKFCPQPPRIPADDSSTAFRGPTMGGFVQRLCWIPEVGLLAGTSRGALLKLTWPSFPDEAPITCTHLRLHQGPSDPCFVLIGPVSNAGDVSSACPVGGDIGRRCLLTVGRGFWHPLGGIVSGGSSELAAEGVPASSSSSHFFITSLFSDEFFDRPTV